MNLDEIFQEYLAYHIERNCNLTIDDGVEPHEPIRELAEWVVNDLMSVEDIENAIEQINSEGGTIGGVHDLIDELEEYIINMAYDEDYIERVDNFLRD